jgi:iron complex transport system ATP-binding protein
MREKAAETLALLEISHLAGRYMNELSSGEAHRVLIGRALVHSPRVLLLDEPSNSLDLFAQQELRTILRKLARSGLGILLVTHQLSDIIPEIERVILMRNGRVFRDGGKAENLAAPVLTELFGLPVDLARRDGYFHAW